MRRPPTSAVRFWADFCGGAYKDCMRANTRQAARSSFTLSSKEEEGNRIAPPILYGTRRQGLIFQRTGANATLLKPCSELVKVRSTAAPPQLVTLRRVLWKSR